MINKDIDYMGLVEHNGERWFVEAKLTDDGHAEYNFPMPDEPGGWEFVKEPKFKMSFYPPDDDDMLTPAPDPDNELVEKANAAFTKIYWDRYIIDKGVVDD